MKSVLLILLFIFAFTNNTNARVKGAVNFMQSYANSVASDVSQSNFVECMGLIQENGPLFSRLDFECKGSGVGINNQDSCDQLFLLNERNGQTINSCLQTAAARDQCEASGDIWLYPLGSSPLVEGSCSQACDEGTTVQRGAHGRSMTCVCPAGNGIARRAIDPGADITQCNTDINRSEGCGVPLDPDIDSAAAVAEQAACIAREEEARRIEEEIARNTEAARAQARAEAEAALAASIAQATTSAETPCAQQHQSFIGNCSAVSASSPSDPQSFENAGSKESCERIKSSSESVVQQTQSQVQTCITQAQSLFAACPSSTGPQTGRGDATVGSGETQVTQSHTEAGSGDIGANAQRTNEARTIYQRLSSQTSQINQEMETLRTEADKCIAAFENGEDDSTGSGNSWGSLAQAAAGALGKLNSGGPTELSGSGGGSSYSPTQAASGLRYSASGNVGSGYNNSNGRALPQAGGVGAGSGLNGFKLNNEPTGPRGSSSQGRVGALTGSAVGNSGSGRGLNFSNEDTNFNVTDADGNRVFTNSKQRNLILGYKKSKPGGGGTATYKQSDLDKHGRKAMLKALKEGRKKFGNHTPLLFKDGKFVQDIIEIKNSLAWKKRNMMQKRRLAGQGAIDKKDDVKKYFHPCHRFGECFAESSYNIFKLQNFRYRKTFYPSKK